MLVPYSWLKDFIDIRVPAGQVGERLSCATIGVEEVRCEEKDCVLDLEVTYNRGDLLSIIGVAREVAALYQLEFRGEEKPFDPPSDSGRLTVRAAQGLSRYYTLTQINSLRYRGTPKEIARRLELAGLRSVNLFADITNYVMIEYGQPLHAFDAERVRARDKTTAVEVRNAKEGEEITTIDGATHNLKTSDIIIADRKGPIAIAGVMGGKETEVGPKTKEILLEAAVFDPIAVRRTARRLGLRSESSNRFEHHLSINNLLKALNKAVKLYQLYGKGRVAAFGCAPQEGIGAHRPIWREPVNLNKERLNALLGMEVPLPKARKLLERLGFKVMSADKGVLAWPPYWRGDIQIEEDLVEEIARMFGYENLPATPLTSVASGTPPNELEYFRYQASQLLAGAGFAEIKSYPFLSTKALAHRGTGKLLKVRNPISAETEYLKDSNILSLIEVAGANASRYSSGRLFELEKIYPKEEYLSLSAIVWGVPEAYRTAKGALEETLIKAGVDVVFSPTKHDLFHPGRVAKMTTGKEALGVVGEVHPYINKSYDLKNVAVFELNFEKLVKHAQRWRAFTPISKYPEAYEDFSFYLPPERALGTLVSNIRRSSPLVKEAAVTDIFEREGKRSVTLQITFQSDTSGLSSKDLKPVREKITNLIKGFEGEPRA